MSVMNLMRDTMNRRFLAEAGLREHVERLWPSAKAGGWADFAFQNSSGFADDADKLAAVTLMGMYEERQIAALRVEVGHTPSADRERDENQSKLADLPHPFLARVEQTNTMIGTADGVIEWTEEVYATFNGRRIKIMPGSAPLEIGYMPSGKTQGHIIMGHYGQLARWPYGSRDITIILPRHAIGSKG